MINYNDKTHLLKTSLESLKDSVIKKPITKSDVPIDTFINTSLSSLEEIKWFNKVFNSQLSNLIRTNLQITRLKEENCWLKEELSMMNDKIQNIDTELTNKTGEILKNKYIYQMKLMKFDQSAELIQSNNLNLIMMELENDTADEDVNMMNKQISTKIKSLLSIIRFYMDNGQLDAASTICKESIYSLQKVNQNHPDIALLLCLLAFIYKDLNNWEDAAKAMYEALKIRESVYGSDTSIVASTLNNLAIILAGSDKYKEAEKYCRKALIIRQKINPTNHISIAKQLNNLGLLLINMKSYDESYNLFTEALNIYDKNNDTNLFKIKTSTNLAHLFVKNEQNELAETQILKNLKTIYNFRFKEEYNQSIIDLYKQNCDNNTIKNPKSFVSDEFIMAEIVNLKFLIKIYSTINQEIFTALKDYLESQVEFTDYEEQEFSMK